MPQTFPDTEGAYQQNDGRVVLPTVVREPVLERGSAWEHTVSRPPQHCSAGPLEVLDVSWPTSKRVADQQRSGRSRIGPPRRRRLKPVDTFVVPLAEAGCRDNSAARTLTRAAVLTGQTIGPVRTVSRSTTSLPLYRRAQPVDPE
jgi:hypothetical protein